jgi:hypothetical protein
MQPPPEPLTHVPVAAFQTLPDTHFVHVLNVALSSSWNHMLGGESLIETGDDTKDGFPKDTLPLLPRINMA